MRDWELVDSDRFSFDDSDRFEEDSLCSWISEPESLCNNWRGWKKSVFPISPNPNGASTSAGITAQHVGEAAVSMGAKKSSNSDFNSASSSPFATPSHLNLVELASRRVASHIPFEMVERFYPPVPEQLQLRIAFWSFPEHEEDIRLYSCLANGSAEEFQKGEKLSKSESVSDILQIGFHLSATVKPNMREAHKVAVTFDRRRITSCTCTCNASTNWCGHVVAVCLHRIFQSKDVMLRAPVSESLSRLHRDQLQKFAQYLISELPQQILPTAQRLLDELLSSQRSAINTLRGAPDPTAGASANEQTTWFLDERTLHGNIHKILIKFCVPAPIVFSDVNYLSSAAPPASAEWSSLLRPLRGREPEGMWNLLSIVREMFRREDRNAVPLLEVITEECLNCDQILVWWFNTKVALHNGNSGHGGKHHSVSSNAHACQHAGSSLCDEIVFLWRLAALNPGLSPDERSILRTQFKEWHLKIIEKISKSRNASVGSKHANSFKNDVEIFPGFRPSIEACYLSWESYPLVGVTYSEASQLYQCPFMCFRHSDGHSRSGETGQIHSSHAILNNPTGEHHLLHSSATISSVPMISKRPRSVDFGGDRDVVIPKGINSASACGGLTLGPIAGPSTLKAGKSGRNSSKKQQHRFELAPLDGMLPLSASGLKIKSRSRESRNLVADVSFDVDDLLAPASSSSSGRSRMGTGVDVQGAEAVLPLVLSTRSRQQQLALQRQPSLDGNRSSVSSEGFCENDNENDVDNSEDKDEGVEVGDMGEIVASNLMKQLNITATSDEFDGDEGEDLDNDSDSSISTRVRGVDLQKLVAIAPNLVAPSKFDSASDSQQSGDEYQLYYYDPKASTAGNKKRNSDGSTGEESSANSKKDPMGLNIFTNLKKIEDSWDVLFARAEGLHAHGHSKEACKLGVKLAQELLANPPDLTLDLPTMPTGKGKRKKVNPASHQISCLASATLAKCGFLCTVLAENSEYFYLAFQVGMFGLELARPPASTKPLEVKLANQEAELAQLLKRIPIGQKELNIIREKAEALKDGTFRSRGEALLPLVLANFIFDALAFPTNATNREGRCALQQGVYHLTSDESLGFEAAVASLGLKANVSEAEHPLLCEGTRRQRGDLALTMLLHYKDDSEKLAKVMDKLLDREIHQLYKAPLPAAYYSNNPPTTTLLGPWTKNEEANQAKESPPPLPVSPNFAPPTGSNRSSPLSSTPSAEAVVRPSSVANAAEVESGCHASGTTVSTGIASTSMTGNSATATLATTTGGSSTSNVNANSSRSGGKESGRFKGKRSYPVLPNQPSEAGAHFMFELAKVVLGKAGGSSNQSLFTQPSNGQNPRGPHRALHMCAFHIGLYALGLHNAVSPNWLSRTYSSHVSWITGQAMEIGAPAIAFLIDTWDSHLTPPEAVTIADRASRGDVNMVRAASELALSCLPFAHALNPNELHRAILQCKEQSDGMLEKACVTVESAAKGGGVYPEVLFDVARQWFSLYQKHLPLDVDILNEDFGHHDGFLIIDSSIDPMNPNNHHQMISAQTGLPPVNPNNPPSLPTSSGAGTSGPQIEIIQMQPQGPPQMSHQALYPMSTPQVPMGIPFAGAYGPPFIPAAFNPVPMAMYPQVIYQASSANNPNSVATSANGYYNQHQHSNSQQPNQPSYPPPSLHPMHSHQHHPNLVSAGQALQYYSPSSNGIQVPITTSGGPHLRQPQFFPMSHISLHNGHAHTLNGGMSLNSAGQCNVAPSHSHLSVVASAASTVPGHPGVGHHGHTHNHGHVTGHYVTIPTGNPNQNNQAMMLQPAQHMNAMSVHPGHGMGMNHGRGPNGQHHGQMNCGNPMMNHHSGFGGYPVGSMGNGMNCLPLLEGPSTSTPSQTARESLNSQQATGQSAVKVKYLLASYRVGMLAMETLARRVHDDRPAAKFARNPPYGEDVKWLLSVSRKLGAQYVQQFCICAVSSIANPFVLHEIILDAAFISTRTSLAWVYQNPRSPLAPLVQKCQQMYFQCLHQKLYHITLSEYEDFVTIVCTAKQAFHLTPDGGSQFKEWLQNLKRSKACKKDLWTQITTALQANPK